MSAHDLETLRLELGRLADACGFEITAIEVTSKAR
jgi:hypothetical protein